MKRQKPDCDYFEYPPDVLWINPEGKVIPVIGHVTVIQEDPDKFGLSVSPITKEDINRALSDLFEASWARGRVESEGFRFQILHPASVALHNVYSFVWLWRNYTKKVSLDFWDPMVWKMAKTMDVEEFLEKRYPASWGLVRKPFKETI